MTCPCGRLPKRAATILRRAAIALRRAFLGLFAALALSCGGSGASAPAAGPRSAVFSRGCLALPSGGASLLLEFRQDGSGAVRPVVSDPAGLSASSSRLPWVFAPSASFLSAQGGRVFAAVNRRGVLALEEGGEGVLRWSFASDARLFGSRSVVCAWWRAGRYHVFLAANPDFDESPADPLLVSLAPGEGRFRVEAAVDPAAFRPGETLRYFCPVDADTAFAQLARTEGDRLETAYLRVSLSDSRAERIPKAAYLEGFSIAPASSLPPDALAICDPGLARARYADAPGGAAGDSFVYAWYGSSSRPEERAYALSGRQDSEWSVSLSAWEDSGRTLVLYPDGSLRLAAPEGVREARLPALPFSFDYEKAALAGALAAASWAESVYPEVGRAGLALYRFD